MILHKANGYCSHKVPKDPDQALLDSPKRWKTIYCLSRKPPPREMMALLSPEALARVIIVTCDFLDDPASIARKMMDAGVRADYVFFYSYVHKD